MPLVALWILLTVLLVYPVALLGRLLDRCVRWAWWRWIDWRYFR